MTFNSKIILYFFLLINLKKEKTKTPSVLVFGMIIYGKTKSLINGRPHLDPNQKCYRQWRDC